MSSQFVLQLGLFTHMVVQLKFSGLLMFWKLLVEVIIRLFLICVRCLFGGELLYGCSSGLGSICGRCNLLYILFLLQKSYRLCCIDGSLRCFSSDNDMRLMNYWRRFRSNRCWHRFFLCCSQWRGGILLSCRFSLYKCLLSFLFFFGFCLCWGLWLLATESTYI